MDHKKLDQQSRHWEASFSNKSEMFGLSQKEVGKFLRINRNALNHYTPEHMANIRIGAVETRGLIARVIYDYSKAERAGLSEEMENFRQYLLAL